MRRSTRVQGAIAAVVLSAAAFALCAATVRPALAAETASASGPSPAAPVVAPLAGDLAAAPVVGSPSPFVGDPAPRARWTLMVYMSGDNDLQRWLIHDIDRELAVVGSNADVQVVALADRGSRPSAADGGWGGARIFHITTGMRATPENAAADWGPVDMGSPQTLVDFVGWARAAYPADRYALVLWDHGWGWWPGNTEEDDTSNDYLDVDEMRGALETTGKVNMVGLDTCLGQTIEVEAQFRGLAAAVAGSEDSIGYTGFAYDRILAGLQADPAMSAAQLAVLAARSMRTGHDRWTLASSAVALNHRWDDLVAAISDLGWDLGTLLPRRSGAMAAARRHAAEPPQTYPEVRDLYDVAVELRSHVRVPAVRHDCTRVITALRRVVLYEWSTRVEGDLHGVAIYWPAAPAPRARGASFSQWESFIYYCSELQFTRLTYWGDFLAAWGGLP